VKLLKSILIVTCMLFASLAIAESTPATTNGFTTEQQTQIKQIIHDYLVQNPGVLIEASKALQAQTMQKMQAQGIKGAKENADELFRSSTSPVAGNAKGNITMVTFLDYQCPYCRTMTTTVDALMKANPNLRVVFKEFPVHGDDSVLAAKAALAANLQGKYWELHQALMTTKNTINEATAIELAKNLGLDTKKLQADMKTDAISKEISATYPLAKNLALVGTPAFIVAETDTKADSTATIGYFPGGTSQQDLQAAIDKLKK